MGKFAQMWGGVDVEKEKAKFSQALGIDVKQIGTIPDNVQLAHIEQMAKDMSWLDKFSAPFRKAFNNAKSYEVKRQTTVMTDFFNDLANKGIRKAKLYMRQEGMDDHLVEYDDSGQKGRMNSMITITGKLNTFKAKLALEALKKKGATSLTVYLKHGSMKDHYVELNDSGEKIPFMEKIKELQ